MVSVSGSVTVSGSGSGVVSVSVSGSVPVLMSLFAKLSCLRSSNLFVNHALLSSTLMSVPYMVFTLPTKSFLHASMLSISGIKKSSFSADSALFKDSLFML